MGKYIGILLLLVLTFAGCKTNTKERSSMMRTIHGYAYDRLSGDRLRCAFILNLANDYTFITDTIDWFTISAHLGDSLCFKYIGLKKQIVHIKEKKHFYL